MLVPIESLLSKDEILFVKAVINKPGVKYPAEHLDCFSDGDKPALWKNPEKLGLIKCVGSWRWVPTDKLKLQLLAEKND